MKKEFEMVIGVEVHVELKTKSKIFCGCSTAFGAQPNTQCCPVCMGMPGVLPVLNEKVVEYAVRAGIATNCRIAEFSKQDRKNYFYPDLPKAYQISQFDIPLCENGYLDVMVGDETKRIGVTRIHIEEDAGKLIHDDSFDGSLVDFNRCGVPLIEIVSEPDIRSSEEAKAYLDTIRQILQYLDISDCKMQEGSMRADINLSVRPVGSNTFGTRTEMKNMNSFKAIARAIEGEFNRQVEVIESGKKVIQETRRWDDNKERSYAMRSKENAHDYRYFPEPDLPPVEISDEWIERVRSEQPEMALEKQKRYQEEFGLPEYDARMITAEKTMADFFEEATKLTNKPKEVSNWIMGDIFRMLKELSIETSHMKLSPDNLAKLIIMIDKGTINRNTAKKVLSAVFNDNADCEQYVKDNGLQMVNDTAAVEEVIKKVLENNPQSVSDYKGGKQKAFGFIVGQCMKELKGKANPAVVNELLKKALS